MTSSSFARILVIAQQLPYPPDTGGRIRHFQLYSRLGQRASLTWVSPFSTADAPYIKEVLGFCEQVIPLPTGGAIQLPKRGWRNLLMRVVAHLHWPRLFEFCFGYVYVPGLMWTHATPERVALIDEVMSSSHFDVVICETVGAVELVSRTHGIPKIISLFDIQSELFRRLKAIVPSTMVDRLFYLPELLKIRRYEARHYRLFDAAVTVSERDRCLLARLCPELQTDVIHNGVDVEYFLPDNEAEIDGCMAFVGHYGYPPNKDAVQYFCQQILPGVRAGMEHAAFLVVGRDAPLELGSYPGVHVIGNVPDVRCYLRQASVVVVPVRAGSGTRIKILEAMAMGKAVVSTSVGAEGLDVVNGYHIVLADEPDRFAQAVIHLLANAGLRAQMGARARQLVEANYDWRNQSAKLQDIVLRLSSKQTRC